MANKKKKKARGKRKKTRLRKARPRRIEHKVVKNEPETFSESINVDRAIEILESNVFIDQRSFRDDHVRQISTAMRSGLFPPSTQICFAKLGGKIILVDGQHRLWAVVESGVTTLFVCTYYPIRHEDQVRELYMEMDQGRIRGPQQICKAQGLHRELDISSGDVSKISTSGPFIIGGFSSYLRKRAAKNKHLRVKFIRDYADSSKAYMEAIGARTGPTQKALLRAPIMSVGIITFVHNPDKASEFWSQVSHPVGLDERDPRFKLRDYLLQGIARTRTDEEWSRLCASAWNNFLKDRHVKTLVVLDPSRPISINKCKNYNGKKVFLPYGDFTSDDWVMPK